MRRGQLLAFSLSQFVLCIAACSGESNIAPQPAPIDQHAFELPRYVDAGTNGPTEKERAAASNYAAALASQGLSQLSALLAPDVHFVVPGLGDGRGRDGALRVHDTLFGGFDGRAFAVSRVWRTASTQVIEWTMTGTHAREWMGVAPTKKPVSFQGASVIWTKDDGTISDLHVFVDVAVVKAQLGAGPKELSDLPPAPAPSGQPQIIDQATSPEEATNVAIAHDSVDALERGDPAAYLATFADDVELHTLERAQPLRGKGEQKGAFSSLHKAISQLDTTVDNKWGVATTVIIEYSINGGQVAALGWIPAARDKTVVLQVLDVAEIKSGKIARIWRYSNPEQVMNSSLPPPPLEAADAGTRALRR
jgi:ketosteroid isomerase-like protein